MKIVISIKLRSLWRTRFIRIPVIRYNVYEEDLNGRTTGKLNEQSFRSRRAAKLFVAKKNRQIFAEKLKESRNG